MRKRGCRCSILGATIYNVSGSLRRADRDGLDRLTQIGIIQEALRSGKITVPAKLPDGIFAGKVITAFWFVEFDYVGILTPNLSILPAGRRRVWNQLNATPKDFVLCGGTALALRLGHRQSVDFDFFSCQSFQPLELMRSISYPADQTVTQQSANTLSCGIGTGSGAVKISFFGNLSLGQIDTPDIVESNGIAVPSLGDLFGMKCATVPQRNEVKDYLDIYALITAGHIGLAEGIARASAIYGRQYNPVLTLQALSFFDDLNDPLSEDIKAALHEAVRGVSLQDLPAIMARGKQGGKLGGGMTMDISLEEVARHVNWYTDPSRLLANSNLFLCQVMARGALEDIVTTQRQYSWEDFRKAYLGAPPGLFSKRAWAYWGLMLLNNSKYPMPERFPGVNQFDWRQARPDQTQRTQILTKDDR